jgi:hypothetical protein
MQGSSPMAATAVMPALHSPAPSIVSPEAAQRGVAIVQTIKWPEALLPPPLCLQRRLVLVVRHLQARTQLRYEAG